MIYCKYKLFIKIDMQARHVSDIPDYFTACGGNYIGFSY